MVTNLPPEYITTAVAWAIGEDSDTDTIEGQLYDRALAIRDEQAAGIPLWLVTDWEPWLATFNAWMAAHPEKDAQESLQW